MSAFTQVLLGLRSNQSALIRTQEQVASGRRILRPSDDAAGTARALSLDRQLGELARFNEAIISGRALLDTAASSLQTTSGVLNEARAQIIQAMSGTLSQGDRDSLATDFELLRSELLNLGNQRSGDRYLFGGTQTRSAPWIERSVGGLSRVIYQGDDKEQLIRAGLGSDIAVNVPGSELFGKVSRTGTSFDGLTGISGGLTADEGAGYEYLSLRHDSTDPGNLGSVGISLVNGGAGDSLLGSQSIVIDAVAGTIQLGSGEAVSMAGSSGVNLNDFVIENEMGGELHLDLSGYTGASYSGTVTGNGSISLDGSTFTSLTFTETDLELKNAATGATLHVDTTGLRRAGRELVQFSGTINIFDTLQGVVDDLRNSDGLDSAEIQQRLTLRLEEFDRNHSNVLIGLGVTGSRSERLISADQRVATQEVQLQSLYSNIVDGDIAELALELAKADNGLQLAQASGARLIQTSLLNFLR